MIVDGESVRSRSGRTFESVDPSTGVPVASVARGDLEDVDRAVRVANAAFEGRWRRRPPAERGSILLDLANLISDRADELAALESLDTGKPLHEARLDVAVAARYFEYYAGAVDKIFGQTIPVSSDALAFSSREPFGVVGHIIPWNYPIAISARTVAPALAAGNTSVLKPAEQASLTPIRLAELGLEAGLPPGVFNVVPGFAEEAGRALAEHSGIRRLSFTGSLETGREVMAACAAHVTPLTMELGGKSPHLIFADADLRRAVPTIVEAIIHNAGQTCTAGSRVIVDRRIESDLTELLRQRLAGLTLGRGLDDPDMGPLISQSQLDRVAGYVGVAQEQGATIVVGGERTRPGDLDGYFFQPTLLADVQPEHVVASQEVIRFQGVEEAIRIANDTPYGLTAAIWTSDLDLAMWTANRMEAGQVFINCYGAGVELPFGGWKQSGFGREKGMEALLEYTQSRTIAAVLAKP